MCMHAQLCLTLCNPMDCSLLGSSVHGIFQARILEWVAISSSRDPPTPGIEPTSPVSPALAGRFFTTEPPGKQYTFCLFLLYKNLISITSPGCIHETSARTWCTGKTQRDRVEREVGGGTGMGNTCISMTDSCQCMTKSTTIL